MINIPSNPKQSFGTQLFLTIVFAIVLLVLVLSGVQEWVLYSMLIGFWVGLSTLNLRANSQVNYQLNGHVLTINNFGVKTTLDLSGYEVSRGKINSAIRTFGVGMDNYNYGQYLVNGLPFTVIVTNINNDVLFMVNGKDNYLISPQFPIGEKILNCAA